MERQLELLAPAGTYEAFLEVIAAGADAVYFGGSRFGARAYAGNLDQDEALSAIDFAHMRGKRAYLAVNTLLKEKEIEEQLYGYLLPYYELGLDAVIVQDLGVLRFVRRHFKGLRIHASTQMTIAGAEGARLLDGLGVSRIVLSRELSLEEIARIRRESSAELECFVHGSLCYSYSGQCLFSSMLGGRSGNRGRCAQPCRLGYDVYDEAMRQVGGKGRRYPLSPKDLRAAEWIPKLAECGVASLKIEGRMKQAGYAAGVTAVYRRLIDRFQAGGGQAFAVEEAERKKLFDLGCRSGFTDGYFQQKNGKDMITFGSPAHESVRADDGIRRPDVKEKISAELTARGGEPVRLAVSFQDVEAVAFGETPRAALRRPLTKEELSARIRKTGVTPFEIEELSIEMEPGLFLSATEINALRRSALEQLEQKYLARFRRKAEPAAPPEGGFAENKAAAGEREPLFAGGSAKKRRALTACGENGQAQGRLLWSASAETTEQISAILDCPLISVLYIDGGAFSRDRAVSVMQEAAAAARAAGKQAHYVLPAVFRSHTAAFYRNILQDLPADGFLVKSYDALGFLLEQGISPKHVRADFGLHAWSNEGRHALGSLRIEKDTVPLELNKSELRRRGNQDSEMIVYGYLPLMTSAQCVQKNLERCSRNSGMLYLKDRRGVLFPVKNHCAECYNVIYNSRPLSLLSCLDELLALGVRRARLSFTVETQEETKEILALLSQGRDICGEHTCGHFKRGVE